MTDFSGADTLGDTMSIVIEPFDARTASNDTFEGVHQCYLDLERDFFPDDPETPAAHHRFSWQADSGMHRKDLRWAAFEGEDVLGSVHVATWVDHLDSGLITPAVRRQHRNRGVGTALFLQAMDGLESEGRSKLIVDIPNGSAGEATAQRIGLRRVLSEKINQLLVTDIDWALMDKWTAETPELNPDYELIFWDAPFPENQLARWCRISDAMNTAPMEDFDLEDTVMTSEKWRSIETNLDARGCKMRAAIAVHKPSGDFAGMTTLMAQKHHPEVAQQDDTVVHPDHRGHNLGRLLKGAMVKRFVAEFPQVTRINTGNAGSNVPMLKINTEMGFRPVLEISAWQGDIERARIGLTA